MRNMDLGIGAINLGIGLIADLMRVPGRTWKLHAELDE